MQLRYFGTKRVAIEAVDNDSIVITHDPKSHIVYGDVQDGKAHRIECFYYLSMGGIDEVETYFTYVRAYPTADFPNVAGHCEWDTPCFKMSGIDHFKGTVSYKTYGRALQVLMQLHEQIEKEIDFEKEFHLN